MKKYLALAALIVVAGCATPEVTAYKSESVVITSVDTGMNIWRDYVNAGHATREQIVLVHKAYDTYYNAQFIAKAALELYISHKTDTSAETVAKANQAVADAQVALINLVTQYIK